MNLQLTVDCCFCQPATGSVPGIAPVHFSSLQRVDSRGSLPGSPRPGTTGATTSLPLVWGVDGCQKSGLLEGQEWADMLQTWQYGEDWNGLKNRYYLAFNDIRIDSSRLKILKTRLLVLMLVLRTREENQIHWHSPGWSSQKEATPFVQYLCLFMSLDGCALLRPNTSQVFRPIVAWKGSKVEQASWMSDTSSWNSGEMTSEVLGEWRPNVRTDEMVKIIGQLSVRVPCLPPSVECWNDLRLWNVKRQARGGLRLQE
jgi:hypothetical protein